MDNLIELATNGWPALIALLCGLGLYLAKKFGFLGKGQDSDSEETEDGGSSRDTSPPSSPRKTTTSLTKETHDDAMESLPRSDDYNLSDINELRKSLRAGDKKRRENIERLRRLLDKEGSGND